MPRVAIAIALLATAVPRVACAAEPPARAWYGGQTVAVDVSSFAVLAGTALMATKMDGDASGGAVTLVFGAGLLGSLGYLVGGPIVHAAHGRWGASLASLGIRIAGPSIGGGLASWRGAEGFRLAAGIVAGAIVSAGLDAALLAWERPLVPDPTACLGARSAAFFPMPHPTALTFGGAL